MRNLLFCHIIAFITGIILDLIFGDPYSLPHPVCLIGKLISKIEGFHLKKADSDNKKLRFGIYLVLIVCFISTFVSLLILGFAYYIHPLLGILIESVMTFQILAMKSLRTESMKVKTALDEAGIKEARRAVSMIVGRDTDSLDEVGVIKATVETVAENTSDGVIAPMLYLGIGGPVLGFLYKAINTMDSMVGYKNDKYLYYGRVAAKVDDVANYIPARLSALFMILASMIFSKEFNYRDAIRICKRDRYNHSSPNSAWTEAVCAGALGIRLAGNAYYFGKLYEKPFIGDFKREPEREDISRACKLMYLSSIFFALFMLVILLIILIVRG